MIGRFIARNKWAFSLGVVAFGFTFTAAIFTGIDAFPLLTAIPVLIGAAIDHLAAAKQ